MDKKQALQQETLDVTGALIFMVTENLWLSDLDQGRVRPCCGLSDGQLGEVVDAVTLSKDLQYSCLASCLK